MLKAGLQPRGESAASGVEAAPCSMDAEHGANPKWTRAAVYWRPGAVAVHEAHND